MRKLLRSDTWITYSEQDRERIAERTAGIRRDYPWMDAHEAAVMEVLTRFEGENGMSRAAAERLLTWILKATEDHPYHCSSCDTYSCKDEI